MPWLPESKSFGLLSDPLVKTHLSLSLVSLPLSLCEMDLIHNSLSNLEIGTDHHHHPHSSSSSQKQEEEMIIMRNWVDLPYDVLNLIFMKLSTTDILVNAQLVCSSWWKLSKQPHLFRHIHVDQSLILFGRCSFSLFSNLKLWREMAREAIDRSCGRLVEFSVRGIATDELLQYMSDKSESLKCLRLICCQEVTDDALTQVCKQFPQLEELELYGCLFSQDVFKTVGCLCFHLKSFRLSYMWHSWRYKLNGMALVIAEAMPELRHLTLYGNRLDDNGLRAILHGCPHLQTLDLRRCSSLEFEGDLKEIMSTNIKLRLPNDFDDYSPLAQ